MSWSSDILIGPGPDCVYCGGDYGSHAFDCPEQEEKNRPRRFRVPCDQHPTGAGRSKFIYGCYFPLTDLVVGDMGGRWTGKPANVEWLDN